MENFKTKFDDIEIYELTATQQASFYGKAKVIVENGIKYLYSYNTKICAKLKNGEIVRFGDFWSMTTARHIKAFCGLNTAQFRKLRLIEE